YGGRPGLSPSDLYMESTPPGPPPRPTSPPPPRGRPRGDRPRPHPPAVPRRPPPLRQAHGAAPRPTPAPPRPPPRPSPPPRHLALVEQRAHRVELAAGELTARQRARRRQQPLELRPGVGCGAEPQLGASLAPHAALPPVLQARGRQPRPPRDHEVAVAAAVRAGLGRLRLLAGAFGR